MGLRSFDLVLGAITHNTMMVLGIVINGPTFKCKLQRLCLRLSCISRGM